MRALPESARRAEIAELCLSGMRAVGMTKGEAMNRDLNDLLREALMCSIFVSPTDPGLTYEEAFEIGRQAGYQNGEIGDTFPHVSKTDYGRVRYVPTHHDIVFSEVFESSEDALLSLPAADFVYSALNERIKADGIQRARLDRGVIVERAVIAGLDRPAVEGAITCLLLSGQLMEREGGIAPKIQSGVLKPLGEQSRPRSSHRRTARPRALALVRDVVARRADGRPQQSEPLDAFPDALEQIGFKAFRMWWTQTVTELRGSDPHSAPVSCVVLSAALVEGALTFAAKYARSAQLGAFQSSNFEGEPRTWKAEKLIESAAMGGSAAIFTPQIKARAEHLNKTRQRVHAGRMLGEYPGGPPDLRPEEGRDAKATAEQVVRAVLDWLAKHSAAQGGAPSQ